MPQSKTEKSAALIQASSIHSASIRACAITQRRCWQSWERLGLPSPAQQYAVGMSPPRRSYVNTERGSRISYPEPFLRKRA